MYREINVRDSSYGYHKGDDTYILRVKIYSCTLGIWQIEKHGVVLCCELRWSLKRSLRMNSFGHFGHGTGSGLWISSMWRLSAELHPNCLSHKLQTNLLVFLASDFSLIFSWGSCDFEPLDRNLDAARFLWESSCDECRCCIILSDLSDRWSASHIALCCILTLRASSSSAAMS